MSNIPSSAIPHAWARDDQLATGGDGSAPAASPPRALLLALGAGLAYLFYRALR